MKKIIYALLFIAAIQSCKEPVGNQQSILLPLVEKQGKDVDSKEYFIPQNITPLKETTDFHIREIKKIESFNNENYVLCINNQDVLAVFNNSGEKVREIGRWGNGHGEHGQITDFCIDKKNKRVIMLCANSLVMVYSVSGEFVSEKILSKSVFGNIASLDGNVLCTTNHQTFTEGDDAFLFYVFDENFNLLKKHTQVLPDYMSMFSLLTSPLKIVNDRFVYSDFYTHRIYFLDSVGNLLFTYDYENKNLMPSKMFREYDLFSENQQKYGFILDNIVINDTILSIYKTIDQVRLALHHGDGEIIEDFHIVGSFPKLFSTDGNKIISVTTIEGLEKMKTVNYEKDPDIFFYIVKYEINRH